jgi:hypothetical protein
MKTLIAALTLGAVIAVPGLMESANAASRQTAVHAGLPVAVPLH